MKIEFEGSRIKVDPLARLEVGDVYIQHRRNTGYYLDTVKFAEDTFSEVDKNIFIGRFVIGHNGWGETHGNYKVIEIM